MKAITIWQPWASMIAMGAKRMETRSYPVKYRGPLVIHAGNARMREGVEIWKKIVELGLIEQETKLPFGVALGVCELADVVQVDSPAALELLTDQERMLGKFEPGWFAWVLKDFQAFEHPVPCRGKQGLWEYKRI